MVFIRRAIIFATCPLSDLYRVIDSERSKMATAGRREYAAVRLCCLPAAFLHRRVQSDLRKARSPHRVPTRRPPDSRGQSNATLTAASDFTEMIDVIRPRIIWSRTPHAVCACSSACAGRATAGRAQETARSSVTRPIGTHSATKMSPLASQMASCGCTNLPGMN